MTSFNLVTEPWIPCVPRQGVGAPQPLSLRDALVTAHQQLELVDSSPLVTVALHRLLLALLHRVYHGPADVEEWKAIRNAACFDAMRIDDYLARWHTRFDLFDAARPFYQVDELLGVAPNSVATLAHELASGNNTTLFDHTTEDNVSFTPAQAARYLVAFQMFAGAGGVSQPFYLSDGPLARDYTVLVRGKSLFETLLLNMTQYDEREDTDEPMPNIGDAPWWEQETHSEPDPNGTLPKGYLDYLTWQSRRIHLVYDETVGVVRDAQIRQNLKLKAGVEDPFKGYRQNKDGAWYSQRLVAERAVWRDSHTLLELRTPTDANEKTARAPGIFEWLAKTQYEVGQRRGARSQVVFDVLGSLNDGAQATVVLWRHEQLPLPLAYLNSRKLRDWLGEALQRSEAVATIFRAGYTKIGKRSVSRPLQLLAAEVLTGVSDRDADSGEAKRFVEHLGAERVYWATLEPDFRRLMVDLAKAMATDEEEGGNIPMMAWAATIERSARAAFEEVAKQFDMSGRSLRALAHARWEFNGQLKLFLRKFRADYAPAEMREQQNQSEGGA